MRVRADRQLTICIGCCTEEMLSDRLPGGQYSHELKDTDIAKMLTGTRFEQDSHSQRRSSRRITAEELSQEHGSLQTKLADFQGELTDTELHSSTDRHEIGATSSHAGSRQTSAVLSSRKATGKVSAAEAEGSADAGEAGRGRSEPDQALAGRQPKGSSSKRKKSHRKGSRHGPVEGVTARGIAEERPASVQQGSPPAAAAQQVPGPDTNKGDPAAPGLGSQRPGSATVQMSKVVLMMTHLPGPRRQHTPMQTAPWAIRSHQLRASPCPCMRVSQSRSRMRKRWARRLRYLGTGQKALPRQGDLRRHQSSTLQLSQRLSQGRASARLMRSRPRGSMPV